MNWLIAHAVASAAAILIVSVATVILQQRRTPQSTWAWLLLLMAFPYVAVPIFLALGFRKQRGSLEPVDFDTSRDFELADSDPAGLDSLLRHYGLPGSTAGNRFELLGTGETAYRELMQLVEAAEHSLDVTTFMLGDDPVGRSFVDALVKRAREGIEVRVILDRLGTLRRPKAGLRELVRAGGKLCLFSPFLHSPLNGHFNLRNHRKMVIADGRRAFAGGMNIAQEYLGPVKSKDRWIDLAFILEGPAVSTYDRVFESDWRSASNASPAGARNMPGSMPGGSAVAQLVPSGPDIPNDALHDSLVYACNTARQRIWIVTPYFLPTQALFDALSVAGQRGIEVRILVPRKSNHRFADVARGAYMRDLEAHGCHIHFFAGGMVHAKTLLIDGIGIVGSANMDARSLLLNFESSLVLYDETSVAEIADWIGALLERSQEGQLPAGRIRNIVEGVFRLGVPLM